MNDYKELIGDIGDLLIAHPSENISKMYLRKAADAIEQIIAEYNELDNAHGELFIEYHKVKKQRDAAIAWLPRVCGYCKYYNGLTCNNKDCRNISGVNTGWEWMLWDDAIPNDMDKYCGICGQAINWEEN